jgi:hypothetical protein
MIQFVPKTLYSFHSSVILLSFLLRFGVSHRGKNSDFDAYERVVIAVDNWVTPWETYGYNYGIIWAVLLFLLDFISLNNQFIFRILVITILTAADLYIAKVIAFRFGKKFGIIFLLNPISVLITGYYNQFDNLALAIGLAALININQGGKKIWSIILLSCSLITKHNLVLFLPWIFFNKQYRKDRYTYTLVPLSVFMLHFLPFTLSSPYAPKAIWSNVFLYWSNNNAPLWHFIINNEKLIKDLSDHNAWHHGRIWMILFFASVTAIGYMRQSKGIVDNFFVYTLCLVIFSSAITSQFYAIAAIGASAFFNPAFILFFAFGAIWLLAEPNGLHINSVKLIFDFFNYNGWKATPFLLLPGIIWIFIKKYLNSKYKRK